MLSGSFGNVTLQGEVAIKESRTKTQEDTDMFINEFKYYTRQEPAARRYIVHAYELTIARNQPIIVMEKGIADLSEYMRHVSSTTQQVAHRNAVYDVLRAIEFLNTLQPPVCHRDVKPGNIIVFQRGPRVIFKLGDFGLAGPEHTVTDIQKMGTYPNPLTILNLSEPDEFMTPQTNMYDDFTNDVYSLCVSTACLDEGLGNGRTRVDWMNKFASTNVRINVEKSVRMNVQKEDAIKHFIGLCEQIFDSPNVSETTKACMIQAGKILNGERVDLQKVLTFFPALPDHLNDETERYDQTVDYLCARMNRALAMQMEVEPPTVRVDNQ